MKERYYDIEMDCEKEKAVLSQLNDVRFRAVAEKLYPSNPDGFVEFIRNAEGEEECVRQLLEYLLGGYKKLGVEIEAIYDNSLEGSATVELNGDKATLFINREKFFVSGLIENGSSGRILVRELLYPLMAKDDVFQKDVAELLVIAKERLTGRDTEDWYCLTSPQAFVSESMSSLGFQRVLFETHVNGNQTLFQVFVQICKKMLVTTFGTDISNSLLEKALEVPCGYESFEMENGQINFFEYFTDGCIDKWGNRWKG